jgi:hypothetical protein
VLHPRHRLRARAEVRRRGRAHGPRALHHGPLQARVHHLLRRGRRHRRRLLPSLEVTRTLVNQLARVRTCGFDVVVGCTMVDAYEHGVMRDGDWRRTMRCEALDKLEEFYLLMRHYCLLMGVASSSSRGVGRINVEEFTAKGGGGGGGGHGSRRLRSHGHGRVGHGDGRVDDACRGGPANYRTVRLGLCDEMTNDEEEKNEV